MTTRVVAPAPGKRANVSDQILALLAEVNRTFGVTVVLITHEMSVVRSICTSAALLAEGRVVDSGRLTDPGRRPPSRGSRHR